MVHVADVERSVAFYALLGFECASRFSSPDGVTGWADLSSNRARIMLARATAPIDANAQAVLLYMYSRDVRGLRNHLLMHNLADGGPPPGEGTVDPPTTGLTVFEVVPRFFMPAGELRIHDPDGYCLLVGQIE